MVEAEEIIGVKFFMIGPDALDIIGMAVEPGLYQVREYSMKYVTLHRMDSKMDKRLTLVSVFNHYLNGIEWTEQWFNQFSFFKKDDGDYVRVDKCGIWLIRMDDPVPYMMINGRKTSVPFVHSMQAIYSALTGVQLHDGNVLLTSAADGR